MKRILLFTMMCLFGLFSLNAQETSFSYDFEDGTLTGWRVYQGSYATADNWKVADAKGKDGSKGIYSVSVIVQGYSSSEYVPKNYVVTTNAYQITATSSLSWYMAYDDEYGWPEEDIYQVVASEDGSNFNTVIWTGYGSNSGENTVSLSEYAGKTLYLGFYHYIPSSYGNGGITLDNIALTVGEGGDEPEPTPDPEEPGQDDELLTQGTVTIGSGDASNYRMPAKTGSNYTISQQIYQASEINAIGNISKIAFRYYLGTSAEVRNWSIYLQNTDRSTIDANSWFTVDNDDLFFDGTVNLNAEWVEIEFDKDFEYTGENLMLCVYDKTGSATTWDQNFYNYATTNTAISVYGNNAYDPANMTGGTVRAYNNQIQLTFAEEGEGGETPDPTPDPEEPVATQYRLKISNGTYAGNYLHIYSFTQSTTNTSSVGYASYSESNNQIFTLEDAGNGNFYVRNADGYYIKCNEGASYWNVDAYSTTEKTPLTFEYINETEFYLRDYDKASTSNYFKAENDRVYCDQPITSGAVVTWVLEQVDNGDEPEPTPTVPAAPVVTAEATSYNTATFTWESVEGATSYKVYSGTYEIAEVTDPVYYASNLSYYAGTEVCFIFTAVNEHGESEATQACVLVYPAAPKNLVATANETTITLTWSAVTGAESYNVYSGTETVATALTDATFTTEELAAGEYCYTVTAVNASGESAASAEQCATIEEPQQGGETPEEPVTVTIGEGTAYSTYSAPIYDYYNNSSISQSIYTSEEMNVDAGIITSLSFNQKAGNNNVRNISVYLKNTDRENFSEKTWETLSEDYCVYSGDFTLGTTGWNMIEFTEGFLYTGGNLLVCVVDNTNKSLYGNYDEFYLYETGATLNESRAVYSTYKTYGQPIDPLDLVNTAKDPNYIRTYISTDVYSYRAPQIQFVIEPAVSSVKVEPETIAFGEVQLNEYWSEKDPVSVEVSIVPIVTEITNITCDNNFFILPSEFDYNASKIDFIVTYDKNASAGDYSGNLTIAYGDGETKVVPMTATAYEPATADVYEKAQELSFTEGVATVTPDFASLKDDYNLPKEVNNGNAPDAVYTFTLTEEVPVTVNVTGTNAKAIIYKEDFDGLGGPTKLNSYKGNMPTPSTFEYDFNDGSLEDFDLIDLDGVEGWLLAQEGVDYTNCLKSYSYRYNPGPQIKKSNNIIVTKEFYNISATSQISFDVAYNSQYGNSSPDNVSVEVTIDGENFVMLEKVNPGSGTFVNKVVEIGELLLNNGLEYGDYRIALRHQEDNKYDIRVDNFKLFVEEPIVSSVEPQINAVPYPAGTYYLVAAAEDAFTVTVTVTAEVEEPTAPAAPQNLAATEVTETSITLTWDAVDGATDYYVYKDGQLWFNTGGATTYTENGLTPGSAYCFNVTAVGAGESELSEQLCETTLAPQIPIPAVPQNLAATEVTETSITLTWDAVDGANQYVIYMKYNSEDYIRLGALTTNSYEVPGFSAGETVCFKVSAENGTGESDLTAEICATTLTPEPETPVVVLPYRLQSITGEYENEKVTYNYSEDESRVESVYSNGNFVTLVEYNEDGTVAKTTYVQTYQGEPDYSLGYTITEYTYSDGVLASSYTEEEYDWNGNLTETTEYTLLYNEDSNLATVTWSFTNVFGDVTNYERAYEYEDGKLVKETYSFSNDWTNEIDYIKEFEYDENGNCVTETQYSSDGTPRSGVDYFYDLAIDADSVYAFAYPHEVFPARANLLTKALSYSYNEDWETKEVTKGNFSVKTYNYNEEVVSAPVAPTNLVANVLNDTEVVLTWETLEEVESFKVYNGTELVSEGLVAKTDTVKGLEPLTEYTFTVVAVNGELESAASEAVNVTTYNLVNVNPAEIAFGKVIVGDYWLREQKKVNVSIDRFGKEVKAVKTDNKFFRMTSPTVTDDPIEVTVNYNKNSEAGEYEGNLLVILASGDTVSFPLTATAYTPVTPDVFEHAQAIETVDGLFVDRPDFATLTDDYKLPGEDEDGNRPDAVYSFTLEEEASVEINVESDSWDGIYAIYKAPFEGNGPSTDNNVELTDRVYSTAFTYDFEDGGLEDFEIIDNDGDTEHTMKVEDGALVSWSYIYDYENWVTVVSYANECAVTKEAYNITEKSVLTFDARFKDGNGYGTYDQVTVQVTKDGETYTDIDWAVNSQYSAEFNTYRVDLGAKFAEKGLEYGEYRVALLYSSGSGSVAIDNLVLSERAMVYPAGDYYLVAAASGNFKVNVKSDALPELELDKEAHYRLVSREIDYAYERYNYASKIGTQVVNVNNSGDLDFLKYNDEGLLLGFVTCDIDENGGISDTLGVVEYIYEDSVLVGYREKAEFMGQVQETEHAYHYNADGRIDTVRCEATNEVRGYTYNEEGLLVEIIGAYDYDGEFSYDYKQVYTYENGNLVKEDMLSYDSYAEEPSFSLSEETVYEYDSLGNVISAKIYGFYTDGDSLVKYLYEVADYVYDYNVSIENVFYFEYPHYAYAYMKSPVKPSHANIILAENRLYYDSYNNEYHTPRTFTYHYEEYTLEGEDTPVAPATPQNFVATATSDSEIVLTWNKVEGATGYNVYQGAETLVEGYADTTYVVTGLAAATTYTFDVAAVNGELVSNRATANATTLDAPTAPAAPVVTAEATSDTTIVLTWNKVEDALSYNVYNGTETLATALTDTTFVVKGLKANTEYTFGVTAVNAEGESVRGEAKAKTLEATPEQPENPTDTIVPVTIAAPDTLLAEALSTSSIKLTWTSVENAVSYNVYVNDSLKASATDTVYTVEGLEYNTEYVFAVTAVLNDTVESAKSPEVRVKTLGEGLAELSATVNIYPNPAVDRLVIETDSYVEEVSIYAITGTLVYKEVDFNSNAIDVSELRGGVYVMKVRTENGEVVKRFVKK